MLSASMAMARWLADTVASLISSTKRKRRSHRSTLLCRVRYAPVLSRIPIEWCSVAFLRKPSCFARLRRWEIAVASKRSRFQRVLLKQKNSVVVSVILMEARAALRERTAEDGRDDGELAGVAASAAPLT